jgi:hypothetical protein
MDNHRITKMLMLMLWSLSTAAVADLRKLARQRPRRATRWTKIRTVAPSRVF